MTKPTNEEVEKKAKELFAAESPRNVTWDISIQRNAKPEDETLLGLSDTAKERYRERARLYLRQSKA